MKIDPDLKIEENFAENKTFFSKCLARDIKETLNPNKF